MRLKNVVYGLFAWIVVNLHAQSPVLTFENNFTCTFNGKKYTLQNSKGKFISYHTSKGTKKVYSFGKNEGFSIQADDIINSVYSIEMVLQLSEVESYTRILDFKGLSTDVGLYTRYSTVVYYQVKSSDVRILRPDEWFHLTITRTSDNLFSAYLNGILAFQFKDTQNLTLIQRPVIFFDDDGSESRPGMLAALNIYDICLKETFISERAKEYLSEFQRKNVQNTTLKSEQTYYEYRFEGNFNPENGKGPVLKPLGKGNFEVIDVQNCGKKGVYHFGENCGFTFENNKFIGAEHTIELYFKFDNLKSWKRIVDYKDRQSDTGPYAFDNQIEFYKIAISKNFPFREKNYAHVVLVREANENYSLYVDGVLRAMFKDINELGIPSKEDVLHFFRDDIQVPNECSSGSIAFLRIYNYALLPEQIAENYKKMPCPTTLIVSKDKPKEIIVEKPKEITYTLKLKIIDEITQKEVTAKIAIKNKEKNVSIVDTLSNGINKTVSEGVYQVIVESNDYLPVQEEITVMKGNANKVIALKKEKPKEITYTLKLKIIDEITQKEVTAKIAIKNKEKNVSIVDTLSNGINKTVSEGVYQVIVESDNYLPVQEEIIVMKGNANKVITLKKIEIGTTVTLENIYFEPNSDKIAVESYQNLINFANYLKNKPNLKVRINGHTDSGAPGTSDSYLLGLSQKRAEAVVNFLVKNGVNPNQLKSKGYGSSKPVASNDTPEGKAKNRRVEFEILEK